MGDFAIRTATPDDVPLIRDILVDAFVDDPFLSWFMRSGPKAEAAFRHFFEFMLGCEPRETQWIDISDDENAVAVWVRCVQVKHSFSPATEAAKVASALAFSGTRRLLRAARAEQITSACHRQAVDVAETKDVAYLRFLACRTAYQGTGLGTGLLAAGLNRCDSLGVYAYLETATHTNEEMYARRGFQTKGSHKFGKGGRVRLMVYAPGGRSPV